MRTKFESVLLVCLLLLPGSLLAQTSGGFDPGGPPPDGDRNPPFPVFNYGPCDFSDAFYTANGFDVGSLDSQGAARFGNFRRTGPPAFQQGQVNWVVDSNCSVNDPNRRNVRILATTGAYADNSTNQLIAAGFTGSGAPTQFFNIIAFLLNEDFFTGGPNATPNVRGFTTEQLLGSFEAYAVLKQRVNGALAPSPCGTMGDGQTPCFPVTSVATPNLRHDWRVGSSRNAIDGSSGGPTTPFAYFGDDLTGSWIVTYFWWTEFAVGGRSDSPTPTATCKALMAAAAKQNGVSLDGTPILTTGDEVNFLEGASGLPPQFGLTQAQTDFFLQALATAPCIAEGQQDVGGADGGPVWLVCPTMIDAGSGAIAKDAFLDVVRKDGQPIDPRFQQNFNCFQNQGKICNGQDVDNGL